MKKDLNEFDRLVIDIDGRVYLTYSGDIQEYIENNYNCDTLYRLDYKGHMIAADSILTEDDFDDLYEDCWNDDTDEGVIFCKSDEYDEEPRPYVKADLEYYEKHLRMYVGRASETFYKDITGAEILKGFCFRASDYKCVEYHKYPYKEDQWFYKFFADGGREFYIRETVYPDSDEDNEYKLISKEEFEKYDDGRMPND